VTLGLRQESLYLSEWFALVNRLHFTPRWRVLRRRELNRRIDTLEHEWDARANNKRLSGGRVSEGW
jgi:hypothetical protein